MFKSLFFNLLLILSFVSFGETAQGQSSSKLDPTAFEKVIKSTPNIQLIDVRTPQEYASGHLSKCQNINFNDPSFQAKMSKLDKNKPIAVYCAVGGRSGMATTILQQMGFKTIYDLRGGINAWNSNGKPVVK